MKVPAAFLGVVLVWSTTPLAVKWSAGAQVSFLEGVGARMLIGAVLASLLLRAFGIARDYSAAAWRMYAAGALGFFGAMGLVYWAAQFVPSGVIALVFGAAPLFAGVLGALVLGERGFTRLRVLALLAALGGLGLVFYGQLSVQASAAPAIGVLVLAVLCYAASAVLLKRYAVAMHPLAQVAGALWLSAAAFVALWLITDAQIPTAIAPRTLGAIAYLSLFGSVLGFMLYFYLLSRLPVVTVSLITLITPPTALVIGWLAAGEQFSGQTLAGGACILLALAVYQWADLRRSRWRLPRRGHANSKAAG